MPDAKPHDLSRYTVKPELFHRSLFPSLENDIFRLTAKSNIIFTRVGNNCSNIFFQLPVTKSGENLWQNSGVLETETGAWQKYIRPVSLENEANIVLNGLNKISEYIKVDCKYLHESHDPSFSRFQTSITCASGLQESSEGL